MPTPRSPLHVALLDYLADGRWHPFEEIVEHCTDLVPPGQAARRAARERQRCRNDQAPIPSIRRTDPGIRRGAREQIRDTLNISTHIERDRPGRGAMYRARP